jgi:1,4-dihydroxy-2-naphthoyl-CoA hydrolase
VPLFRGEPRLEDLNARSAGTMVEHLGIEFVAIGDDHLDARMPVDRRTIQPYGVLHGGASAVLAETLGSVASSLSVDTAAQRVVGFEISVNHLRPARAGFVHGTCRPVFIGRSTHVWDIRIVDDRDHLVSVARLTVRVLGAAAALPEPPA